MANPYNVGATHFVAKEQYYRSSPPLTDILECGNPLVRVTGSRRIGKSWFLQWIEETAPADRYICVRLLLAAVPDMAVFVQHLWNEFPASVRESCPSAERFAVEGDLNKFLQAVDGVVGAQGHTLVLLLDEEEAFSRWAEHVSDVFTHLFDAFYSNRRVRVVLAVSQRFSRNAWRFMGHTSWLSGDFDEITPPLAELDDADADRLIRQTQLTRPVEVKDELCAQIRALTNNRPYLLQLVCRRLYDAKAHRLRSFEPHIHAPDGLFRSIYQGADDAGYFREALHQLTDLEKAVLLDIAVRNLGDLRSLPEAEHEAIAALQRFGYIRTTGTAQHPYVLAHDLWRCWLTFRGDEERSKIVPWPRLAPPSVTFIPFDLQIRSADVDHWEVTCLDSLAGQSDQPVVVPKGLSTFAAAAHHGLEYLEANQLRMDVNFEQLGEEIGDQLCPDPAGITGTPRALLRESLLFPAHVPARLRIQLRLHPDSAQDYPWETVFCPGFSPSWLAVHPQFSLVRFVPLPKPCDLPPRTEPLRIMLAHAEGPPGHSALNFNAEWDIIKDAMKPVLNAGRVQIVAELTAATEADLRHNMNNKRPHVVHLIAHGSPGIVYLHGDAPGSAHSAAQMADIFQESEVRLAVLNVCNSVRVAHALATVGVPAVVAMQGVPIDQFATQFSCHFYGPLSRGRSVDEAIFEARDALAVWKDAAQPPAGWCIPVLYSRIPDGRI